MNAHAQDLVTFVEGIIVEAIGPRAFKIRCSRGGGRVHFVVACPCRGLAAAIKKLKTPLALGDRVVVELDTRHDGRGTIQRRGRA